MGALIHYYIHGRGRGHATRSRAVIDMLRAAGYAVRVFAGEDARALFSGDHTPVLSMPLGIGWSLPALLYGRVRAAGRALRQEGARIVLSDGDMPSMLAGRLSGVPTVAIGHGLVFSHCHPPPGAPRAPWRREALKARLASVGASHCIAVNFAQLSPRAAQFTSLARPVLPMEGARPDPARPAADAPLLCYFRDGNGDAVAQAAAALGVPVILFGGAPEVLLPGVTRMSFSAAAFHQVLLRARAVLSSAGSQLMSECLLYGIPQLALFQDGDDEQRLNAHMLQGMSLYSYGLPFGECSAEAIEAFVRRLPAQPLPLAHGMPARAVTEVACSVVQALIGAAERAPCRAGGCKGDEPPAYSHDCRELTVNDRDK